MANYASLKSVIAQTIKTNGQNDVTAAKLLIELERMIDNLGSGYQFKGIASPSTNPGSPDQRVFYIATSPGEYTHFETVVEAGKIAILSWDTSWQNNSISLNFADGSIALDKLERGKVLSVKISGLTTLTAEKTASEIISFLQNNSEVQNIVFLSYNSKIIQINLFSSDGMPEHRYVKGILLRTSVPGTYVAEEWKIGGQNGNEVTVSEKVLNDTLRVNISGSDTLVSDVTVTNIRYAINSENRSVIAVFNNREFLIYRVDENYVLFSRVGVSEETGKLELQTLLIENENECYFEAFPHIAEDEISTNQIADGAITEDKLADKSVTMAKLADDVAENLYAYGVELNTNVSSPALTRIGNLALHRTLPIQSNMRGCLLDDDGNVIKYLNASTWVNETRDGSQGQVMVEIPDHYRKCTEIGTKRRVMISELPLAGYEHIPKHYVSAYQATVQRSANKLASVVNLTADYRGGNNTSAWDDTYRSLLGRPASNISLTNFRTYARNRKANSTKWNCHTYGSQKAIYWLFVIEYATLNSQAAYNAAKSASGYAQGGLGDGVTNANGTSWSNFNAYNPFVPCGYTDEFGNGSGVKALEVRDGDGALFVSTYVNRYRGIEIPFGHIYHWMDGVLVEAGAESDTNLHKVFVAKDPSKFASSIGDGYAHVGNQARSNGYGKEHIFGEGGEIIAAAVGGGSTTYLCDYNYQDIPASGKSTRGVLFGGYALSGAAAGFVSAYSYDAPSSTYAAFGSRLCFLPTTD